MKPRLELLLLTLLALLTVSGCTSTKERSLLAKAENGDAAGQNASGEGVTKDSSRALQIPTPAEAFKQYLAEAEQGLAAPQEAVAEMYEDGVGVAIDHAQAVMWYRKAAEQGSLRAQYKLANLLMENDASVHEAVKWFSAGAKQGSSECLFSLGRICYSGWGKAVPRDQRRGLKLLRRAANKGDRSAMVFLSDSNFFDRNIEAYKWCDILIECGDKTMLDRHSALEKLLRKDELAIGKRQSSEFRRHAGAEVIANIEFGIESRDSRPRWIEHPDWNHQMLNEDQRRR